MTIKVNYAALDNAASQSDTTASNMNSARETLQGDLQALVNTWEGEAQQQYYTLQQKWDAAHEELTQILAKIGTAVADSRARYQERENKARDSFMI